MFLEAFGLNRDPFLDTADPTFYYDTLPAAYGRRRLVECLSAGRGLAVIVGPIGAGKTTLLNAVSSELLAGPHNQVGLILDPTFASETELLVAIGDSLGYELDAGVPVRQLKEDLKRSLFASAQQRQPVLVVDEAQLLPEPMLETLRALLNYQLDDRKLLSIALSGQMELAQALLGRPNIADRVALWIELSPLRESESSSLLEHRLRRAGYAGERSPFDEDALHILWFNSAGVPRRIVTLAREAMEVAAERSLHHVRLSEVEAATQRIAPLARSPGVQQRLDGWPRPAAIGSRPWWQWWKRAS